MGNSFQKVSVYLTHTKIILTDTVLAVIRSSPKKSYVTRNSSSDSRLDTSFETFFAAGIAERKYELNIEQRSTRSPRTRLTLHDGWWSNKDPFCIARAILPHYTIFKVDHVS